MPDRPRATFDAAGFYAAADAAREALGATWRHLALATGCSQSTFTRMKQGRRPDVDTMAALADWAGLRVDSFVVGRRNPVEDPPPLAVLLTAFRRDPALSPSRALALEGVTLAAYRALRDD